MADGRWSVIAASAKKKDSVTSAYTSPGQIVFDAGRKIHQIIDKEIPYYCPTLVLRCISDFFERKTPVLLLAVPCISVVGPGGGMGREVENLEHRLQSSLKPRISTSLRYKHFNNKNLSSPTPPFQYFCPINPTLSVC